MRKLEALKIRWVQEEEEKNTFHELENFFFSCYFVITPFHLHFKDDF
jgi:hypothetical protein